jgi:hypothetical protein
MVRQGWKPLSEIEKAVVTLLESAEAQTLCTAWLEAKQLRLGMEEGLSLMLWKGGGHCIDCLVMSLRERQRKTTRS